MFLVFTLGCGTAPSNFNISQRFYNGTASVGDFFSITLDPVAHSLTYKNVSNGDSGTTVYTVNEDGTYALSDPAGNLVSAYEVPGYALLIEAAKTGPTDHGGKESRRFRVKLGEPLIQLHAVSHDIRRNRDWLG